MEREEDAKKDYFEVNWPVKTQNWSYVRISEKEYAEFARSSTLKVGIVKATKHGEGSFLRKIK